MTCAHERIRTFYHAETGECVPLWACADCDARFVPMPELIAAEADNARLRKALTELIRLKDQKLLIETQIQAANDGGYCRSVEEVRLELDYNERKPKAWEQARASLAAKEGER